MGSGRFSYESYSKLKTSKSYDTKSRDQIFVSRQLDPDMDPVKVIKRESRDSKEHPESLSIIVGLDVTGSMGFIPEDIVKNTLPDLMGSIMESGIEHPQVLFLGLGDFVYDEAPLQVGQFESSAELLDRWLTKVYLEGGGGGNDGESYNLAHLIAARHTSIDCWEKRRQKGFLITIGDEPCLKEIPASVISRLTSADQGATISTKDIIAEAQKMYHVFHIHIEHNSTAKQERRKGDWKDLLGQNFIVLEDYKKISKTIAQLVIEKTGSKGLNDLGDDISDFSIEDML